MTLEIIRLTLGPLPNNVYLLGDQVSGDAVVIDPSFDSQVVLTQAEALGWTLRAVWLTHGHFDHLAGASAGFITLFCGNMKNTHCIVPEADYSVLTRPIKSQLNMFCVTVILPN